MLIVALVIPMAYSIPWRLCLTPTGNSWISSLVKESTQDSCSSITWKETVAASLCVITESVIGAFLMVFISKREVSILLYNDVDRAFFKE